MYMVGHDDHIRYLYVIEMLMKCGNTMPHYVSNLTKYGLLMSDKSKTILAVMRYNRNEIVIRSLIIISIPPDIFTMRKIHAKMYIG